MKKITFILLILFALKNANAQTQIIGSIVSQNKIAIAASPVFLLDEDKNVLAISTTNQNGNFGFSVPVGLHFALVAMLADSTYQSAENLVTDSNQFNLQFVFTKNQKNHFSNFSQISNQQLEKRASNNWKGGLQSTGAFHKNGNSNIQSARGEGIKVLVDGQVINNPNSLQLNQGTIGTIDILVK